MKKIYLLTLFWAIIIMNGRSQFQHSFGTSSREIGSSVQFTSSDAGYIVAGVTTENFLGSGDATLVKTDANGFITWSKVYGGTSADLFTCVREVTFASTAAARYVAVGQTYSYGFGGSDVFFVLANAAGVPVITRVFGGQGFDKAYCVQNVKLPTGAPGFVIVGETNSFANLPGTNVYVILTDQLGNLIRSAVLGYKGNQSGYWIEQTSDGGFALVGTTTYQCGILTDTTGVTNNDIYVVKLDNNLNLLWDRIVGGGPALYNRADIAYSLKENPIDKSLIITGRTHSFSPNTLGEAYLLNFSSAGAFNFLITYGLKNQEEGHSILVTKNTVGTVDYLVAGYTSSVPYNNLVQNQALLFKTDMFGSPYWTRIYGLDGSEAAMEVHYAKMPNLPGYVFTGYETSFGAGSSDIYLVETDENGKSDSPCEEEIKLEIKKHDPCIFKSTKIFYVTPAMQLHNIYKDVDYITNKCSIIVPVSDTLFKAAPELSADERGGSSFIVAPNPASTLVFLQYTSDYQNGTLNVVNIHGKHVFNVQILTGNRTDLIIDKLPSGLYFLKITKQGSKSSEFYKLIKQQ